jgi:hypothetical protein
VLLVAGLGACSPPPPGDPFTVRWARAMSGPSEQDEIDGVAAGRDGSVFVTGKFERSTTIGGRTLTSAGAADIPFARFDAAGRTLWAQRFGGTGEDNLFDVDGAPAGGAVGTGWFEGTVQFGGVTLTSAGASDCVIVSVADDGSVRWARRLGGPRRDGCNEVTVAADGSVVTSIDTEGGWTPPGLSPIAALSGPDTLLVRLRPDGTPQWLRRVGGPGAQRGKSLAVAPDGSIVFGGDTRGELRPGGAAVPMRGAGRDAWFGRWSPAGDLQWTKLWGGPGDDIVKGLATDGARIYAVGSFTGTVDVGGASLSAGTGDDLAVVRFGTDGSLVWATSVTATSSLLGAEVVTAPDGGVLFGGTRAAGMRFRPVSGTPVALDEQDGGIGWLAAYRPDGSVGFARTIAGTVEGRPGELARSGRRIFIDVVLRGSGNTGAGTPLPAAGKDASVWAIDLASK